MFLFSKDFEHSLRSSSSSAGTILPAMPSKPGAGLNPEFHRGCTGKAHACGTIKNQSQRYSSTAKCALSTNNNNNSSNSNIVNNSYNCNKQHVVSVVRKTSVSSETISDNSLDRLNQINGNNANDDEDHSKSVGFSNTAATPRLSVAGATAALTHKSKTTPSPASGASLIHKEGRGFNNNSCNNNNNNNNVSASISVKCGRNKSCHHPKGMNNVKRRPPWKYCSAGGVFGSGNTLPTSLGGNTMTAATTDTVHQPTSSHFTCFSMQNQCHQQQRSRGLSAAASSLSVHRRNQHNGGVQWHILWERSLLCNRGCSSSTNITGLSYKNYDQFIYKQKVQIPLFCTLI